MTFWFDVEDLIIYFRTAARPTGIQRLTFEIYRELWRASQIEGQAAGGRGGFCRHGSAPLEFLTIDWPALEAGILALGSANAEQAPEAAAALAGDAPEVKRTGYLHAARRRMPLAFRLPLGVIYRAMRQIIGALRDLALASLALLISPSAPATKVGAAMVRLTGKPIVFTAEDVFIALGAAWGQGNYAAGYRLKQHHKLHFALLIHDLIPQLHPEWTSREGLPAFQTWLREVVPHADQIFAVSRNSANDLLRHMAAIGATVPAPVVLPVGFRRAEVSQTLQHRGGSQGEKPYVLFVSTIEIRKNHLLMFRVWRRLLETMPEDAVPQLVFAGRIAWLTRDFLVQVDNTNWLNGKIRLVESPAEAELAALYQGCWFTVFPSFYEGWGLPVTESLGFGKTVAASNRASIPEAGGAFCTYYDPENLDEAYRVIREMIESPVQVADLEALIAEKFDPPSWSGTAAAILASLTEATAAGAAGAGIRVAA